MKNSNLLQVKTTNREIQKNRVLTRKDFDEIAFSSKLYNFMIILSIFYDGDGMESFLKSRFCSTPQSPEIKAKRFSGNSKAITETRNQTDH